MAAITVREGTRAGRGECVRVCRACAWGNRGTRGGARGVRVGESRHGGRHGRRARGGIEARGESTGRARGGIEAWKACAWGLSTEANVHTRDVGDQAQGARPRVSFQHQHPRVLGRRHCELPQAACGYDQQGRPVQCVPQRGKNTRAHVLGCFGVSNAPSPSPS